MSHNKNLWIQVIILILLIGIITFQFYINNDVKRQIAEINNTLENHKEVYSNIIEEISNFKWDTSSQFDLINEKLQISKSQIFDLKKDISNIKIQSNDFTGIIDDILPAIVSVKTEDALGSGVIISDDGYIVTNYHVIEDGKTIKVLTYDNDVYKAILVGASSQIDITLLKIEANDLDYLEFGDSNEIQVGQRVIALGNPLGLSFTVTEGIVSATNRVGPNGLRAYIQTDVPINPGNSGGPLVNIKKEIIGINNFKIGGFESLGFAIDSNHIKEVVDEILEEAKKLNEQT